MRTTSKARADVSRERRKQGDDEDSLTLAPIHRRSLLESGMRRPATRFDFVVIAVFFVLLLAVLGYFLTPILTNVISHLPDLFSGF